MKRTTIHISAALALALALAGCTKEDTGFLPEGAEGSPMVFTATGLNPAATASPTDAAADAATRAPVDGNWEGVTSVAVMIGGKVKAYDVTPTTADNTSATLTSDDPHYWTDRNDLRVTAWWPYNGEENLPAVKVRADQSTRDGYEGSDFIAAEEQAVSYANPTLRFTHRTARVTVVLTDRPEESMNVRLTGLSTGNGNPAEIAPYNKGGDTWSALVAPQAVTAGTAIITCTFTSGKSFVYKTKFETEWNAGEEYTYTVSLAAAEDPGYTYDEATNTYEVYNANGLLAWGEAARSDLSLNCTLTDNIDLTGKEWTPIGDYDNSYAGTFDGGGHTITGLTIYLPDQDYVGLFGWIGQYGTAVTVKHLTLAGVEITGNASVGGVVGYCIGGTLTDCSVSGNVTGSKNVGGVMGYSWEGTLTDCYATGNVSGSYYVGGVVGGNTSGTLTACYATGDVSGSSYVGGVAGQNWEGTLTACYHATGDVTGTGSSVGGVAGQNNGTLTACYATGDVSGSSYVGGVAGWNTSGTLTACYHATGNVTGSNYVGGVVGWNYFEATVTGCYWRNNLDKGAGYNDDDSSAETTKVDGTTVTWVDAVDGMNTVLQNAGSSWQYELPDENSLPVLTAQ